MYKLVVVDDEDDIREALTELVDWKSWGYTVVGSFADAESAIEYIFENPVDVVMTDIKMNKKSGIDIAKIIHNNDLYVKVIILSGYREFEYAKESIENDVYSYLLKPTDPKELHRVFAELKKHLDKTVTRREIDLSYKEQFVYSILYGNCTRRQIEKYLIGMSLQINADKCRSGIILFNIKKYNEILERWKYEKDLFGLAVINFIKTKLEEENRIICAEVEEEQINVIILFTDECEEKEFIRMIETGIDELCNDFMSVLNIKVEQDIYFVYDSIYEMADKFFKDYNRTGNMTSVELKNIIEMKKELISRVFTDNREEIKFVLENYINILYEYGIDVSKMFVNDIFVQIYEILFSMGISEIEFDFTTVAAVRSSDKLLDLSLAYVDTVRDYFNKKDIRPQYQLVENAKKYIHDNYNKDISLNDVSDYVFVSSAYLSRIFKRITGVKFIDYLTEVRIEKAKELLKNSDYKVYDICDMIGYKNNNYFVALFREKMGMTPLEYRKFKSEEE